MQTLRDVFIERYFHRLQEKSIDFCIPRGYAGILTEVEKDIDLMMSPANYDLAMELFSELMTEMGGFVIENHAKEKSLYMKGIFQEIRAEDNYFQGVYIHVVAYITVKKYYLGRDIKYIGRRVWLEDVVTAQHMVENIKLIIPAPVFELFLTLVRYQQKQKQEYLDRCTVLSKVEDVRKYLGECELAGPLDHFLNVFDDNERLKENYSLVGRLYPLLFGRKNPARILSGVMPLIARNISSMFHATGRLIFFSGPDGSGKTTANEALSALLKMKLKIHVLNTKHLYPLSNRYSKKGQQIQARIRGIDENRKNELERDRGHGYLWRLRRGLGLVFLLLQVYPGYLWARYKNWKGYTVIVDTSFFDVFVKGHRPVFPIIEFVAIHLIPCGSAWFLLKANPEDIVARKPELTIDEIESYYKRLDAISKRSNCIPRIIQSDRGVDAAIKDMLIGLSSAADA
ncbi:hypothetical protein ACFL3A_07240 [Pseudomonadota bacterium]